MSETFSEKLKRRFEEKRRAESIGNLPVEERRKVAFAEIGRHLDGVFNAGAEGEDRKTGFILMVFPFHGHEGRCNYMSNGANRADVINLLKEQLAYFEGQAEIVSKAVN